MITPDLRDVRRYLGWSIPEDSTLCEECVARLNACITPRSTWRIFPLRKTEDAVIIENMVIQSDAFRKYISGCSKVILAACTLGHEPDRLIRRASIDSILEASGLQAAGSAMTETYFRTLHAEIGKKMRKEGYYTTGWYSPGYGDLPLSLQKDFARLLDLEKTAGITLTDSFLMIPSKSMTAFIGLSEHETSCHDDPCGSCAMAGSCVYRRKGETHENI